MTPDASCLCSTVFRGDVVTLQNPLAPAGAAALLVRRLVALPGDEMVSDSPDDAPFVCVPLEDASVAPP